MSEKNQNPLKSICHPYIFALQEGKEIRKDLLDYSLLLLQRNCTEIMRSDNSGVGSLEKE